MAWLYKRPGSKKWWIGWRDAGRQFLISTRTSDKNAALAKLHEQQHLLQTRIDGRLTEQFIEAITGKSLPAVSLARAVKDWIEEARGTTAPVTVEKYEHISNDFLTFLRANDETPLWREVQTEHVRQFLNDQHTRISARTANDYRRILSEFFNHGLRNEPPLLKSNPVLPIKSFKAVRGEVEARRALTIVELQLIYSKAPNDFWRYMIMAGFYTGQRMGDLVTMKWGSVDFGANIIRLTTRKTGRQMQIPISAPLLTVLTKIRDTRAVKPSDCLWPEQAARYERLRAC